MTSLFLELLSDFERASDNTKASATLRAAPPVIGLKMWDEAGGSSCSVERLEEKAMWKRLMGEQTKAQRYIANQPKSLGS